MGLEDMENGQDFEVSPDNPNCGLIWEDGELISSPLSEQEFIEYQSWIDAVASIPQN